MLGQAVATVPWCNPDPELWVPSLGPVARKVLGSRQNSQLSSKSTQRLVGVSQSRDTMLLGPLSSVTTVQETTAQETTACRHELDWLGFALVLKRCLTANTNTKCSKRTACAKPTTDIPPADHHHREKRIKHSNPQHTFPFLAALRGSH